MKTNNSAWLQPALSVIAQFNAPLAEQIRDSNAVITVVDDPEVMFNDLMERGVSPRTAIVLSQTMGGASGLTIKPVTDPTFYDDPTADPTLKLIEGDVWLRSDVLEHSATRLGTTTGRVAAQTLVHEWVHHNGGDEEPAYDAGIAFADLIGEHRLAMEDRQTKLKGLRYEAEVKAAYERGRNRQYV